MIYSSHRLKIARKQREKIKRKAGGYKHQHSVAIVRYLTKNFWILLIPALRALIAYSFNLVRWMKVVSGDIIIIAFFFLFAWARWFRTRYKLGDKSIFFMNGIFSKHISVIPYTKISAVTVEKKWWQYPLKCSYISIDTDAKSIGFKKTEPDAKLIISDDDVDRIFDIIQKDDINQNSFKSRISKSSLVAFSLLFSSALSGVTLLTALLINAGDIIDNKIEESFFDAVNSAAKTVNSNTLFILSKIPTAAITLAIIIFIGWLISFIGNLMRHMHFTLEKKGGSITITDGFLTIRKYHINRAHINYADLQQNLTMKLFGVMSVNVSCSGYGKSKNEIPVFIPISKSRQVRTILKRILPDMEWNADTMPLKLRYIFIYIGPPIIILNLVTAAAGILIFFFREWFNMIFSTMLIIDIPIIWMTVVKTAAFYTSGISYAGRVICIKYSRWFEFHTILVPEERIAKLAISRTIFQRLNGSCNITVYTNSEYTRSHTVRGVSYNDAMLIFNRYFNASTSSVTTKNKKEV